MTFCSFFFERCLRMFDFAATPQHLYDSVIDAHIAGGISPISMQSMRYSRYFNGD